MMTRKSEKLIKKARAHPSEAQTMDHLRLSYQIRDSTYARKRNFYRFNRLIMPMSPTMSQTAMCTTWGPKIEKRL